MSNNVKVIFRVDVRGIAQAGEVKSVSQGYARNYLFPRQLALLATDTNMRQWETERQGWLAKAEHLRAEAKSLADKIAAAQVVITAKVGTEGRLFGSVSRQEIVDALAGQGITVDKHAIDLPEPIKQVGTATVPVRLGSGIQTQISITVKPEAAPEA
jgi:large subunit ribosomal protein L9